MPRRGSPYGPGYQRVRRLLLGYPCALRLVCDGAPADSADHFPALSLHAHVEGSGCCILRPACLPCQFEQGRRLGRRARRYRAVRRYLLAPSRDW
jgi:hypothetical protein